MEHGDDDGDSDGGVWSAVTMVGRSGHGGDEFGHNRDGSGHDRDESGHDEDGSGPISTQGGMICQR